MIEYKRRMKIILTFTLLMIPGALSLSVMGHPGGKVTITCEYDQKYTTNQKYFCKGPKPSMWSGQCIDCIRTDIKGRWSQDGRFSLYDDTQASVFIVTITNLYTYDSGIYQCGVHHFIFEDSYTEVRLTVTKERAKPKESLPSFPTFMPPLHPLDKPVPDRFRPGPHRFGPIPDYLGPVTSEPPVTRSGFPYITVLAVLLVVAALLVLLMILCNKFQDSVKKCCDRQTNNKG
nr:CMRF35-like molecule 2 isoform X1 [Misgurnus anguillicaudatus]